MNLPFISQDFWFLKLFQQERLPGILLVLFLHLQFLLDVGMILRSTLTSVCILCVGSCVQLLQEPLLHIVVLPMPQSSLNI